MRGCYGSDAARGLNKRDMIRPKLIPPRGVLYTRMAPQMPDYGRYWPADELLPFVEHFWTVTWDLAEPEIAEVLPHPSVQLTLEAGSSRVTGVPRGRFVTRLAGRGRVLGTKFRPGGFRPFLGRPLATLTGRILPLAEVFGAAADELEEQALAHADPLAAFEVVQRFLLGRAPQPDPEIERVGHIAERAATDREITRVAHLESLFGLGARALQRLFAEYVGVSPKWVIQRYRLHEAAERIADGGEIAWAELAHELGYADQAHFIRDFRRLVGRTPADYAREFADRAAGGGRPRG
jgi:AraC-like DNA-binding protein